MGSERTESTIEWRDGEFRRGEPLPTYDPSRERVVPLAAVVLEPYHARQILSDLQDYVVSPLRDEVREYMDNEELGPRALEDLNDAETMVGRLRSALDGEG